MCGRYALYKKNTEITEFLKATSRKYDSDFQPNYNVAPTQEMPVGFTDREGDRVLEVMHWGFMKWKPKPGSKPFLPINARDEEVASNKVWKDSFSGKRCIIPADGFYEWSGKKGNKTPHYVYPTTEKLFGFAGIYSDLAPEGKQSSKSYAIITTSPNKIMEHIHDRMPVILHPEEFDDWLNPDKNDPKYLKDFLRPFPEDAMDEYKVSKAVGNVRNNNDALIQKSDLF